MSISIPPGTDPFELLGQLRADLKASLMYVVVWMAIVLFDYCATLPLEIRYIWPSKLSPLKIIFLALLGAFLVIEVCWMSFTSTLLGPLVLPPFVSGFLGFHGCIAVGGAGLKTYVSSAFWAAPLLFDATILTLTLYKITSTERHAGGKVPILQRILKSSILYFVPIASMHLVTTAMAAFTRATLKSFNPPASLAFTGIAATRLVLSLFDSSTNSISNQATGSGIFFWNRKKNKKNKSRFDHRLQQQQQQSPGGGSGAAAAFVGRRRRGGDGGVTTTTMRNFQSLNDGDDNDIDNDDEESRGIEYEDENDPHEAREFATRSTLEIVHHYDNNNNNSSILVDSSPRSTTAIKPVNTSSFTPPPPHPAAAAATAPSPPPPVVVAQGSPCSSSSKRGRGRGGGRQGGFLEGGILVHTERNVDVCPPLPLPRRQTGEGTGGGSTTRTTYPPTPRSPPPPPTTLPRSRI
ncbi:hypothetical protein JCM3766R1_005235 [Sporobolomyces carnicolor]